MAVLNRIKFDGMEKGGDWIVHKYPADNIPSGSVLVVGLGQRALFVRGGEITCDFKPGTYQLTTGNFPILSQLQTLPFGGETPFVTDIYFINTTARGTLRWGTKVPPVFRDTERNTLVRVRAFGRLEFSVIHSTLLITRLVGTFHAGETLGADDIDDYLSSLVQIKFREQLSKLLIKRKISLWVLPAYLEELARRCKDAVFEEFERFGIEVSNFLIESLEPDLADVENPIHLAADLMECPSCGVLAQPGSRFCTACGAPVGNWNCPVCGAVNRPKSNFCKECGAPRALPGRSGQ